MSKAKILIVEDEGIVAIDIQNILDRLGYTISGTTFTGKDAIKNAKNARPDLVLMDIGLKGNIDGIEAAKIIKDRYQIPVVYLTGFADTKTLQKANETNPLGFILKPITEKELQTTIKKALIKKK